LPSLFAIAFCGQSLQAAGAFLTFSPSRVTFSGSSGGMAVTQTVSLLNTGSAATDWTLSVDSTAPWLTVSPASGRGLAAGGSVTITVTANPANLNPNASPGYQANITPQGSPSAPLGVTFNVSGTSIGVIPNPISVSVLAGTQVTFTNVAQISGKANVTITVTSGTWLTAVLSGQAPAPFSVIVDATNLTASTTPYQGSLLIQCTSGPSCIAQSIQVVLTVYSQLTLNCVPAAGPAQVGIAYSTTCTASGGDNSYLWSIATGSLPAGVSLSATTGGIIQVSGTPTTAGPYSYAIGVSDRSPHPLSTAQTFRGTIAPSPTLSASPSTLSFGSYIVGGTLPTAQTISLSSHNPDSGLAFTTTPGSDCAWLTLSPVAVSTPVSLGASVNPAGAIPGNHSCLMTFSANGVSPSPTVTATLSVTSPSPTLTAAPATLAFGSYTVGGAVPAAQNISVSSTNPNSGLTFTYSSGSDCAWLALTTAAGSTPATVTASINSAGATPGNHSCLITFNSSGNASGASLSSTVTATLTIGAGPVISAVVNAAGFTPGAIAAGSWAAVFGTNLAPAGDSRQWNPPAEIVNGQFPTSLDGTSVTVNGNNAAVAFISPTQVNIQLPDDTAAGPVQVVVSTTAGGARASFTSNYAQFAPGLFVATSSYLAAQHADGSYVGGYAGATPAKPGEVITLWGTGFGPANPPVPAGQVFTGVSNLVNEVTVTIGGQPAVVDFAGVVGAGLVQINVHVPSSIGNGDASVMATVGGVSTQGMGNLIAVQN
jgi:uncharacterized protein (TIGR03437 family)